VQIAGPATCVYAMQTFIRKQEDKAGRRKEKAKQASRVA
jgi:hypothetical protein